MALSVEDQVGKPGLFELAENEAESPNTSDAAAGETTTQLSGGVATGD